MQQDRFIATAQLGITLASLGLGMYGEHTMAAWLEPRLAFPAVARLVAAHTLASVLAIAALTYLHIFLGEMVPKALALSDAERTARAVYWPMRLVLFAFYPLVYALNGAGNLGLRLLGIRRQAGSPDQVYTPEELQIIVEESAEGGALRTESGRLLHELLEFGDLTAGEAMVPRVRVVGIPVGASPADVRAFLLTHHHTRYPIYEGDLDHIVGMLHVKDLLRRILAGDSISAGDLRPMPVVPESATLDDVLGTMQRSQAHLAIVIDEYGGTAGVISLEDLFEEVVGEIDEGVPAAPPIVDRTGRIDSGGRHGPARRTGTLLRSGSGPRGGGQRERTDSGDPRPPARRRRRGGLRPDPPGGHGHERARREAGAGEFATAAVARCRPVLQGRRVLPGLKPRPT